MFHEICIYEATIDKQDEVAALTAVPVNGITGKTGNEHENAQ